MHARRNPEGDLICPYEHEGSHVLLYRGPELKGHECAACGRVFMNAAFWDGAVESLRTEES